MTGRGLSGDRKGSAVLSLRFAVAVVLGLGLCGHAKAGQVCAWLVEKAISADAHDFDIWLQADTRMDFLYQIVGTAVTGEGFHTHSPSGGTFVLDPGKPERVWGFGTTMWGPARVEIGIELHRMPKDIFSKDPTPVIASFSFTRDVPARETKVPAALAKKQCKTAA